jgi:hypothetical protein
MTGETPDADMEETPVTQTRSSLPNHKLTIALVGLAIGFIILVALNMD